MKVITHEQIVQLDISKREILNWVDEMIMIKDKAILPPKTSLKLEGNIFYNTMPCILPEVMVAGVKMVNRYPKRIPSIDAQIMLYDLEKGHLKAILDGNYITVMRTAAVAVHSIQLLAKKDFRTIGLIGLGNTARATLSILTEVYDDRKLKIKLFKYKDQDQLFIERFNDVKNVSFETYESYEEVVMDSDVIISCVTHAEKNFCEDQYFKEGCLVVPIHTKGFQNCDLFFDKVYADDESHVSDFKYFNKFRSFAEVADVCKGKVTGRETEEERILVYNIGIAIHDIFLADKVYNLALSNFNDVDISLNPPTEKFWV